MSIIKSIRDYRKVFKNWIYVIYFIKMNRKIINVILRDGKSLSLPKEMVYLLKELSIRNLGTDFFYDKESEIFQFLYNGKRVKLRFYKNGIMNGDPGVFSGEYDCLEPINGHTVIDIGANIGDSTVYFVIKGARIVLALEPYKYSYNMLVENIRINDLKNVITINAGYGKDGIIELEDTVTYGGTALKEYKGGVKTPLLSLKTILEQYSNVLNGDLLLKMDCEGCEYALLEEDDETLKKFKKIVLEFHYGYKNIESKLKNAGFSTEVLRIQKSSEEEPSLKSMALKNNDYTFGILYAELI